MEETMSDNQTKMSVEEIGDYKQKFSRQYQPNYIAPSDIVRLADTALSLYDQVKKFSDCITLQGKEIFKLDAENERLAKENVSLHEKRDLALIRSFRERDFYRDKVKDLKADNERLVAEKEELQELLRSENERLTKAITDCSDCPNCPNVGYYADGDPNDPEQVQCEWCETVPYSKFNIARREAEITKLQAEVERLKRYGKAWDKIKKWNLHDIRIYEKIEATVGIPQDEPFKNSWDYPVMEKPQDEKKEEPNCNSSCEYIWSNIHDFPCNACPYQDEKKEGDDAQ